jgi:hypothetical protein
MGNWAYYAERAKLEVGRMTAGAHSCDVGMFLKRDLKIQTNEHHIMLCYFRF